VAQQARIDAGRRDGARVHGTTDDDQGDVLLAAAEVDGAATDLRICPRTREKGADDRPFVGEHRSVSQNRLHL
jgi:hypothetical protein